LAWDLFDFSVFFDFSFLRFSTVRRFAQKKESFDLWFGNSMQFKTVSKFLKILNFANFSTI
jgi:hypothetical protein